MSTFISVFSFNKHLYSFKTAQERLNFFKDYCSTQQKIIDNLRQMNQFISDFYPVYNASTKADLNFLVSKYISHFKDYRSSILHDSKKKDYPEALKTVHNRMIQYIQEALVELDGTLEKLEKDVRQSAKRSAGETLAASIRNQKKEYVGGFDDPSEGVEAWDSLILLVEDGTVTVDDLPDYGIEIPNTSSFHE